MKKYHLADALTACELICAVILSGMAILRVAPAYALWVFAAGKLCDAYDGTCARRWPYPDDGKYRWWRVPRTVAFIEHMSDILLGLACGCYLILCINPLCGLILLGNMAVVAGVVELIIHNRPLDLAYAVLTRFSRTEIILARRVVYLIHIAIALIMMLIAAELPIAAKIALCGTGICIGVYLIITKYEERLKKV